MFSNLILARSALFRLFGRQNAKRKDANIANIAKAASDFSITPPANLGDDLTFGRLYESV